MGLWFESLIAFEPFNTGCTMFIHTDMAMLFICAGFLGALIRLKLNDKYMYIIRIIIYCGRRVLGSKLYEKSENFYIFIYDKLEIFGSVVDHTFLPQARPVC